MNRTCTKIQIYDTTLRDGAQGEGISFSVQDKLRIAQKLDKLGVAYIEGGWPGSNPRDAEFFAAAGRMEWQYAKITAFGSTRRAGLTVEQDENLQKLIAAGTPAVAIFGKTWLLHVDHVLKTTPEENLAMIRESCAFLAQHGREVIFDAEHFFDGYKDDPEYAVAVLRAAADGGAVTLTLCDTNGGTMPVEVFRICELVRKAFPPEIRISIHAHNDGDLAVANSIMGVRAGCG